MGEERETQTCSSDGNIVHSLASEKPQARAAQVPGYGREVAGSDQITTFGVSEALTQSGCSRQRCYVSEGGESGDF